MKKLLLILLFISNVLIAIPEKSILFFKSDLFFPLPDHPCLVIQDIVKNDTLKTFSDHEKHPLILAYKRIQKIAREIGIKYNALAVMPYTIDHYQHGAVYVNPEHDITNKIIYQMNYEYLNK